MISRTGLHLINFDPSQIKADEAAILKYNRLRGKYRSDLQPFDVSHKISAKYKVADNRWTLSKALLIAQKSSITAMKEWNIHGLNNEDKTSDYVNVTLQCLFNCENLRRVFLESKDNSIIKRLYELYKSKKKIMTKELKKFVNQKYLLPIQYDVCVFMKDLFEKLPILQQIFGHEISTVLRFPGCGDINRFCTG